MATSLKTVAKNNIYPAVLFKQTAQRLPGNVRKALGKCGSILYQKRKALLLETIYERAPTHRPFTHKLRKGEWIRMMGNSVAVGNTCDYATLRGELMEGISLTWGHDLESKFASRAVDETEDERKEILEEAFVNSHSLIMIAT